MAAPIVLSKFIRLSSFLVFRLRKYKTSGYKIKMQDPTGETNSSNTTEEEPFILNEENLLRCRVSDKQWSCPMSGCCKILSRKQTLTSHLVTVHKVESCVTQRQYKLYESDSSQDLPRTTAWSRRKKDQELTSAIGETESVQRETEVPNDIIAGSSEVVDMDIDEDSHTASITVDNPDSFNCSNTCDETAKCDSAPLYVIKCDSCPDGIYSSKLSKTEHELAVLAFAARHNLSDTALEDLLALLNLYLPDSNLLDHNIGLLKERCGFSGEFLHSYTFCNICKNTVNKETESCATPNCPGRKPSSKNKSFFMTGNLKTQLIDILTKPGIWESLQEQHVHSSTSITDITDGKIYKNLKKEGNFLSTKENISLTLFTDGVPLFKSSGVSMWPVYLLINEIPRSQRFQKKNMLLWGVWQGVGKPAMTVFLKELVKDLAELYHNGFKFTCNSQEIHCRAMLAVATMDLQAGSAVLKMTQHNGEYACVYCTQKGKQVKSGKGHCKAFPYTEDISLRTCAQIREDSRKAQQNKINVYGFQGQSVLLYLDDFELNINIVIDYMHGFLLGITKKFLTLWFDSKYSGEPFYIRRHINAVDEKLMQVTPPHRINRLPRKISTTQKNWKASELRAWLLFYSLPCLQGSLPDVYLKHFSLFVEAAYTLLTEGICQSDLIRVDMLIKTFMKHTATLYSENVMGLNMHNLKHVTDCVSNWGPMWAWSCFSFESFNGEIKKTVHGTGNVCLQIFWALMAQKHIEQASVGVKNEELANFIKSQSNVLKVTENESLQPCIVRKTFALSSDINMTRDIKSKLEQMTGTSDPSVFRKAKKIIVNGLVVYSKHCTKVKKRNSYTVVVCDAIHSKRIMEIEYFLVKDETLEVLAVGRQMEVQGNLMPENVPHLQIVEYVSEGKSVERAKYIQGVLVSFKIGNQRFVAELPNLVEGD